MTTKVTITAEIHQSDRRVRVNQTTHGENTSGPQYIHKTGDTVELLVHQGHGINVVEEQQERTGEWVAG